MSIKRPIKRSLHGWVLLDKPVGPSSNQALQRVKRAMQASKAGHCGSLDPLASGLLPICLGEATKFSGQLLEADKVYEVTAAWGIQTATGDREGEAVATSETPLNKAQLAKVLPQFLGETQQIPPMYSALKHNGERLYKLAREQQKEVVRKPRTIILHQLTLNDFSATSFSLTVGCSKGTYIRTLIEDIALALNGRAHVAALRRIGVGELDLTESVTLEELEAHYESNSDSTKFIQDIDLMNKKIDFYQLTEDQAFYLQRGQPIQTSGTVPHELVRLYVRQPDQSTEGVFLGLGLGLPGGQLAPKRLLSEQTFKAQRNKTA